MPENQTRWLPRKIEEISDFRIKKYPRAISVSVVVWNIYPSPRVSSLTLTSTCLPVFPFLSRLRTH